MGDGRQRSPDSLAAEHDLLGTALTDMIAHYARTLDDRAVCPPASPAKLQSRFAESLPATGMSLGDLLDVIRREVLPNTTTISSPRYFGLFNPAPLPIGVWVDALCAALNQNAASWRNAPVATVLEARVIAWLCDLVGFDHISFGTLTSGGSEANLIGLKCARDRTNPSAPLHGLMTGDTAGPLSVYASNQCHYSLVKSADILGLGRHAIRMIDTDAQLHIRLDALRAALDRDRQDSRPCCIVGVAGATSTGVIDPLDDLADIADEYGAWFHVDAAYGGALAFSDRHRDRLHGITRADSVTIDPHKWMFVPIACGALLVRDGGRVLRDAFDITPAYLSEQRDADDSPFDFFRYGQLGSRRGVALTLWAVMKHLGVSGYAEIIDHQIGLTHYLADRLDELDDFERVGRVETAVCCFRYVPAALRDASGTAQDALQQDLQQRIERSGRAWLATTVAHGRRVLRVNIDSPLTERRHIDQLVTHLQQQGDDVAQTGP